MKNKLIILSLALALTGCNVNQPTTSTSESTNESTSVVVKTYSISYSENEHCKISLSKTEASRNEVVEVYVNDIDEGYEIDKITANGFKIDDNSFIMPNEDVEIVENIKSLSYDKSRYC